MVLFFLILYFFRIRFWYYLVLKKYRVRHLIFCFQLMLISWTIILSSCLITQIIGFILPTNELHCVFASLSLPAIDLQMMPILAKKKKIIFSNEAHLDLGGYVNKQNCCIWGTENPQAYIEKPTHPKRVPVWCVGYIKIPSV